MLHEDQILAMFGDGNVCSKGHNGWRSVICPIHGERKASGRFYYHHDGCRYKCMACDADTDDLRRRFNLNWRDLGNYGGGKPQYSSSTTKIVLKKEEGPEKLSVAVVTKILNDAHELGKSMMGQEQDPIGELVEILKVPAEALFAVARVGMVAPEINAAGNITEGPYGTFGERNPQGEFIGISRRFPDWAAKAFHDGTNKKSLEDTSRGLYYADDWDKFPGPVWVVEGGTDTPAGYHAELPVVGRPGVNLKTEMLIEFLHASVLAGREICYSVENDQNPKKGTWPGMEGSLKSAQKFTDAHRVTVKLCPVPEGYKDLRSFLTAKADYRDKVAYAAAGQEFSEKSLAGPVTEVHPSTPESTQTTHVHKNGCCDHVLVGKKAEIPCLNLIETPVQDAHWLADDPLLVGKKAEIHLHEPCECDKDHYCDQHTPEFVHLSTPDTFGTGPNQQTSAFLPTKKLRRSQLAQSFDGTIPDYYAAVVAAEADPLFHKGLYCKKGIITFLLGRDGNRMESKFGIIKTGCHEPDCHACECRKRREKYEEILNCVATAVRSGAGVAYRHVTRESLDAIRHAVKDAGCESKTVLLNTGGAIVFACGTTEDGQLLDHKLPPGFTITTNGYQMIQIALANMDTTVSTPVTSTRGWEYKEPDREKLWEVLRKGYEPFAPSIWILEAAGLTFKLRTLHGPRIELSATADIPPDWTVEQIKEAVKCASLGIPVPADRKCPKGFGKYAKHCNPKKRAA